MPDNSSAITGWRYAGLATISFLSFLLAWIVASHSIDAAKVFLPSPLEVLNDAASLFRQNNFVGDILASIWRVTAGFVAAVVIAVPIGLIAGTRKWVDALVQPLNDFVRYMPVAAFIPLSILWFGIGDSQKVIIIFAGTVFQLIPLVADTAARTPRNLVELGRTMGLNHRRILQKIVVPWCMPVVYDHCRVALGWAWSYLVVAELVAANSGIGHVIIQSQRFIQTGNVITGIVIIGMLGLAFDQLFKLPKRFLFPWV